MSHFVGLVNRKTSKEDPMEGCIVPEIHEVLILDKEEPATYKATMETSDSELWLGVMKSEMESMYENQVWNLIDLPEVARPIEC